MQNKNTILVVDDQSINIDFIVTNFKDKYNIKVASNGEMALKVLDKFEIDLVLLDIQMPIMDGYETIKEIKKQDRFKDLPVIFLTAKTDSDSLIKGFELGAKDYIRKPFSIEELIVRINALVARSSSKPQIIAIGNYTYHTKSQELYFESTSIPMTYRETEVLHLLTLNINEVVQKDILLTKIWGKADFFNGRSLDVFITKLRKKLSLDPTIKIINCRGQGYKLFVG